MFVFVFVFVLFFEKKKENPVLTLLSTSFALPILHSPRLSLSLSNVPAINQLKWL